MGAPCATPDPGVDRLLAPGPDGRKKTLLLGRVEADLCRTLLAGYPGGQDVVVLCGQSQLDSYGSQPVVPLRDKSGQPCEAFDLANLSPVLAAQFRSHQYQAVVIPYADSLDWRDPHFENFFRPLTEAMILLDSQGNTQTYAGENLHRLCYNKSYLCSLMQCVPGVRGKRVLDAGCSDGLVCDLMLRAGARQTVGIDMLPDVGCGFPDPRSLYCRMDLTRMGFADASFDLSFSIATLEHVADPLAGLAELVRVTAPGGHVYVQAGPLYHTPFGHHMFGYFDHMPWIHLRLSPDEIIEHCRATGLAARIEADHGIGVEYYVRGMLDTRHVNMLLLPQYQLERFQREFPVKVLAYRESHEGKDLLTPELRQELSRYTETDLTKHGFELSFEVLA